MKKLQSMYFNGFFNFRINTIYFLLFLNISFTNAQGILKGKITDKSDNTPLIAVNVVIKGTTVGTVTNHSGEYILPLKAGTHTIQMSYMGYETYEETVIIEDNKTLSLDIKLAATSIMGEEVVVTMQAKGQLAAVNQQLRSNQIINVVSAERIRELPDENAAQAISRLPGVHLDESKVVIRGLEPKMNKIMVNGIEMPSTEANNRATDLGMISANMLSGIEVYKTLTPDMDADAIGGVVNLRLREASEGLHYSVTAQGNYNQQEKYMGKNLFWGDISNRFFNNRLGVLANVNYEKAKRGADWYKKEYSEWGSSQTIGEGNYVYANLNVYDNIIESENIGSSLVIDFDINNGQIVFSGMLNSSTIEETEYLDRMEFKSFNRLLYLDRNKRNQLILNNSLRYEQQLGIVNLDASVSNVRINQEDEFKYLIRYGAPPPFFISDSTTFKNLETANTWDPYNWVVPDKAENMGSNLCQLTPGDFQDNQWIADINMKIPLRITENIDIDFKFGGKYKRKERNNNVGGLEYNSNNQKEVNASVLPWLTSVGFLPSDGGPRLRIFRDFDYEPNEDFMNNEGAKMEYVIDKDLMDEMWLNQVDRNPETTLLRPSVTAAMDDYWGYESITSGYIMGEINLGKKITLIPGLRVEQAHNEYSGPKVEVTSMRYFVIDTLTRPATHTHWLPHLHFRFKATEWWDMRFSYNNTLTRPDYNHAIPTLWYHTSSGTGSSGNPNIKPATSENLDANFTFYSRKLGLVTIGGFYKTISGVFYKQPTVLKNIPDSAILNEFPTDVYASLLTSTTTFFKNNPYKAYVKGIEFEWQSNLTWLPSPFNGIVLNANYTKVWSETKYMQHRLLDKFIPTPPYLEQIEADTFYVNRLINQADDLGNISIGYDYKGFSARISFRFQGNVMRDIGRQQHLNEYSDDEYKFDFVVKQKIPFQFGDLEVFFNAINFTNEPSKRYRIFDNLDKSTSYVRYTGSQYQLGIRFRH